MIKKIFILLFLVLCSSGCATLKVQSFVTRADRPAVETDFFESLDRAIQKAGVRDAADFSVKGFPYLRSDGYLVGLKPFLDSAEKKAAWVEKLRQMDLAGRRKEVQNLSEDALQILAREFDVPLKREALLNYIDLAGKKLLAHDQRQPAFYATLDSVVTYRSEYSEAMRWLGLYPIIYLPVRFATDIVYNEFRHWHGTPPDKLKVRGKLLTFIPAGKQQPDLAQSREMLANAPRDVFGAPQLSDTQIRELAEDFAPVFVQDVVAPYDLPGEIVWKKERVTVETSKPVVYYYPTYSFIQGQPVLQLNYAIWFSARAGAAPIIEHGPLDGNTVRITFDPAGEPVMMDTTNSCGCYFFFAPRKDRLVPNPVKPFALGLLSPAWLPDQYPKQRLALRMNSGWHQIQNLSLAENAPEARAYQLLPYDVLEHLPRPDGQTESVFSEIGIMKNSWRIEPALFFSMGIYEVGTMRQRGHHAIKLVGKAHFTEPGLFDANFSRVGAAMK